ncbi:MAG: hypothetical protein NVSMB27_11610 [Ktedonobacteraceae bacterium]
MGASAFVSPILPGKQEDWRRFCQELLGSRRSEYEESQRRLGITRVLAWLTHMSSGEMVIVYLEAEGPERVIPQLAASDLPFDRWFRRQLLELHGLDMTQPTCVPPNELIFVWNHLSDA